ncbi:glycosyltransferase [Pediococcus acidilactici NGRI 0510Q]|uniref:Glycosyltransferase family 2 protein n=1 Tax=Pediococcus acidilactici TaxID=1254 RepID=A0AAW8YJV3_PEDAC|nr:glycosyltransferase family 2 protein [Pediococcus acidilactici]GAC46391.1 glycosyltransferase [Pediococcus acidilactici NGRI 0510Q]KRN90428.1 glycosyltransferase [Pediococcus acidilactici]MDV2621846.1 glycosyltransferase family 2 protein [Pediococcus acidilactici]QIO84589.1 glycosyltransferase family 2 protein [Pediococcus acidilactici]QJW86053.1 glycosyltransferase family 2 protein [Pediococcus acidilactici]
MYVTAIVPAHNEAGNIKRAVRALKRQVDKVIVVCDRCDDDTYQRAQQAGARAFETVQNEGRKAGALNQALENYVDWQRPDQYLFICDADTVITEDWIEHAKRVIVQGDYDAVGSVFYGTANRNKLIEFCQQLEWYRYANQVRRSKKVFVLTGTASLIRAETLQKVRQRIGTFYREDSITEDFALTLDLKAAGAKMISPLSCYCTTEIMPTWRLLYLQRRRWYLGALQQVTRRRWDKMMLPYVFQQLMLLISVFAFLGLIVFTTYLMLENLMIFSLLWFVIGVIFATERVVTIWDQDFQAKFFALMMLPELMYSLFLQLAYLGALLQLLQGSTGTWNHLNTDQSKEA